MSSLRNISILFASILFMGCNNLCKDQDCSDNGYCYDGACICEKWYSGEECSLRFNRHYEGEYIAQVDEEARTVIDTLRIQAHHTIPNRIYAIDGPYMDFVTDSTLEIPMQDIFLDSNWITIEGRGKFNPDELEFTLGKSADYQSEEEATIIFSFKGKRQD